MTDNTLTRCLWMCRVSVCLFANEEKCLNVYINKWSGAEMEHDVDADETLIQLSTELFGVLKLDVWMVFVFYYGKLESISFESTWFNRLRVFYVLYTQLYV